MKKGHYSAGQIDGEKQPLKAHPHGLAGLPEETLIKVIETYSINWITVDRLWFSGVEEKYGLLQQRDSDCRPQGKGGMHFLSS